MNYVILMLSFESDMISVRGLQGDFEGCLAQKGSSSAETPRIDSKENPLASEHLKSLPNIREGEFHSAIWYCTELTNGNQIEHYHTPFHTYTTYSSLVAFIQ